MARTVTLIGGDGAANGGGEFAPLLRRVLAATGAALEWVEFSPDAARLGADSNSPERRALLESIRSTGCALEAWAPPPGKDSGVLPAAVSLAADLELEVCVHPRRSLPQGPGAIDLLLWSGTTEGPHAAVELRSREPETERLALEFAAAAELPLPPEPGFSVLTCTRAGAERVLEAAFEFAREHGRARLRVGTRSGQLQATDGLFLHTARNVAVRFPDVTFTDWPIGDLCRELAHAPEELDLVVVPPLWGPLLAELASGRVGGVDCAPSFHLGAGGVVLFGAAWPAPKKVAGAADHGPWGLLLACVWMLRHLGEAEAAQRLEQALDDQRAAASEPGSWRGVAQAVLGALA